MQSPLSPHHDLSLLGSDATHPFQDLNLAGTQGVPPPATLAAPAEPVSNKLPDFSTPVTTPVTLQARASEPSLTLFTDFAPDPLLPDAKTYEQPYAIDMYSDPDDADPLLIHDIASAEMLDTHLWTGLGFSSLEVRNGLVPDTLLPELAHLDLCVPLPNVEQDGRPGDLDPAALDVLHANMSQQASSPYPATWMDQRGMNTTRSRHFSLLDDGLDSLHTLDGQTGQHA